MNKKGTLMYLIFLGLLIAIGALFLLRDEIEIEIKVKGEWQVDFLKENYFEAQKDLLRIDIVAKNIGTEIAFTLANKGGFTQNSECGQTNDLNLWNNQQQWCLPTITENVITLSQEKFPSRLPNLIFSEYGFNENLFWGKGEKATIVSEQGTYIYDTSFAVNLGYSFEEYLTLQTRAQRLVSRCRNDNDLHTCLNQEKPDYWKYTSCTEEQFSEDNRKVPFCVQSPNLAVLPVGTFLTIPTPITYPFALDFTPTTTFSVESFTVTCEVESCEITMPRNDQAELYTVHFTNSPTAANLQGPADVVFATILGEGYGEFYETASFTNPSGTGEITYLLESTNLRASDNYFFTITVTENSQESEITHFEQVTIG